MEVAPPSRPLRPPHRDAAPDSPSPHLSVFLTNLRLLDLDLLPDWPEISAATFATSGAGVQGQKRRVQCVEWALFRLFSLWDPQETANKLKPFFPPLDQLQSLNLRAALLRALDNAKKNGVLGRDTVIRKTMLDECKGQRLEEVLADFSTAVLKSVVAHNIQRHVRPPALAADLALEDRGYQDDNSALAALVLAHRFSLRRMMEAREVSRARYCEFMRLLDAKEHAIARRNDAVSRLEQQGGGVTLSEAARAEMRRTIRTSWSGNDSWAGALLGDSRGAANRDLLAEPFDRVWRCVQQGRLAELEESRGDLLDQLDHRIRMQRERLKKWEAFRSEAFRNGPLRPSVSAAKAEAGVAPGLDLGFNHHQDMQIGYRTASMTDANFGEQSLTPDYADLVDVLRESLARIRNPSVVPSSLLTRNSARCPNVGDQGSEADVSNMENDADHLSVKPAEGPAANAYEIMRRLPSAQSEVEGVSAPSHRSPLEDMSSAQLYDQDMHTLDPVSRKTLWEASSPPNRSPRPSPVMNTGSAGQKFTANSPHILSPTQQLADQILESINNASPSPTRTKPRPTLSLAQRTRLSMARADNLFLQGDEPESPRDPAPAEPVTAVPGSAAFDSDLVADQDVAEDLVSRTRRSMAGFEKAKQKAQLERRRSQRKSRAPPRRETSLYPPVEEEAGLEADGPVCEQDMEAVFRSRPKIKASPITSPTRSLDQESE